MRKENSTFNTHFMSEPGVQVLHNNDYHGSSELEGFACYVVADGLLSGNDNRKDISARLAVEAVITAFNAKPSIGKRAVSKYLEAAHSALRGSKGKTRRRASITVVVTDYQKLRYGYAGNCRFHLFRSGKLIAESKDHSMSWQMMEDGHLTKDKIAYHEERNNLAAYCGTMRAFSPTVSKAIKLQNADIFSLFTRGVWENVDAYDILSSVQVAENDPIEASNELERLILDAVPVDGRVENYTACFVFVDKVFLDPEAKKRRKRIIILSVIAFIIIVIIVVVIVLYVNWRERTRSEMETAYLNGIEHIHGSNFVRAGEELQTAYGLAERLRDRRQMNNINNYILLVDAVVFANDHMEGGRYELAMEAFGTAANRARYADNLALNHIESQRERVSGLIDVHEYIFLGDTLADIRDWDNAEARYLSARSIASRLHYTEGRREASDALTELARRKEQDLEEQRMRVEEHVQAEVAAAEFIIEGDRALRDGDLVGAALFYQIARDRYLELGNHFVVDSIDQRLASIDVRVVQNEHQLMYAADYVTAGDEMMAQGQWVDAKRFFLLAREIYANLGEEDALNAVQAKIALVDIYLAN